MTIIVKIKLVEWGVIKAGASTKNRSNAWCGGNVQKGDAASGITRYGCADDQARFSAVDCSDIVDGASFISCRGSL